MPNVANAPREGESRPRRIRFPSAVLTARGWGLTVAMVVMLVAGYVFGILELYAMVAAACLLLTLCLAWTHLARWNVTVDRQLHGLRAGVGDDVVINLRLTNRSTRPSPALRLQDPVELGGGAVDLTVAALAPGAAARGAYRLRARARGVYLLGPLSLSATDPFGLTQRVRTSPGVAAVIVHPKVEALHVSTGAAGLDQRPVGALPAPGQDNDEFSALREYQPGDDLRKLHWASTAKTGALMVREEQIQHRGQLTVLVDLQAGTWPGSSLERGLSAAASVALASLDAGLSVRVVTTAGGDSGTATGRAHGARILDDLAGAEVHSGRPFAPTAGGPGLPRRSRPESEGPTAGRFERHNAIDGTDTLVVVGGEGTAGALRARSGITRSASVIQLVIEGAGRAPDGATHGNVGRVVRVGSDGLAAAWNRVAP